ncbi:MAG TPA: carboxypeptidase regulatory-like domain-containing protein [Xanthobacteraceae bacterium]
MTHAKRFGQASVTLAAIAAAGLAATALIPISAQAADVLLSGSITTASGEKLNGVTVSAKAEGSTITTTVFTDDAGNYYFPPLAAGKYAVWAQALTFATAKSEVDLAAGKKADFKLSPLAEFERQLPGDLVIAALPDETPEDARLKNLVHNNCTGCHTPNYPLQHKFDAAGWSAIIDLMKHVNVSGVYLGPDRTNGVLDFNQKELASYLARARGPGETSMKFKLRPRPTGEAARVVYKEYDVPLQTDSNMPTKEALNDGSDWSLGTPSRAGSLVHDSWADLDGNIWFTSNVPNHTTSLGRIDAQTGAVKMLKVNGQNGMAANTHGMTRDPNGIIWFNVNPGKGSLGRLDPKTEQIQVFQPPNGVSPTGGATTVDWDGKGKIWVSSPEGALRFDPQTESFTEYKSRTYKTPNGTGTTYGAAGDREGNGWWAEMTLDIIGHADAKTGEASELKLPRVVLDKDLVTDEQRAFYEKYASADFNQPVPWNEGPRRMGSDKNGDVLWVGNSWGGSLAKIDIHTMETSFVPLPGPGAMQPYHVAVDSGHNAWLNIWTSDVIMKYDPASGKWTTFDLPTRGTEARYISLLERDGKMEVVLPYSRTSKVAVMTFRNEADLAALKAQAAQ